MAPVLGAQSSPCLEPGEYQFTAHYRQFTADKQYRDGSELNPVVTSLNTQVISKMKLMELGALYALNDRWNLAIGLPYVVDGSSSRALPATVAGSPRFEHSSSGIGDMQVGARYWLRDCMESPNQNLAIGFGVKIPTGDSKVQALFPNAAGQDIQLRDVDQSIQPGDDGWGISVSLEFYKVIGNFTVFANGAYLFNPKGHNDTLSAPAFLNPAGPTAVPEAIRFNTVADSYIVRGGFGYPIQAVPGLSLTLAARIDGAPSKDVFGDDVGFRRPGYLITMEPGITYSTQRATYALSIPTRVDQYVEDSLGAPRDSTFADYMVELGFSFQFGQ
jgi:hypothetical protein